MMTQSELDGVKADGVLGEVERGDRRAKVVEVGEVEKRKYNLAFNKGFDQGEDDALNGRAYGYGSDSLAQAYLDGYTKGYASVPTTKPKKRKTAKRVDTHALTMMDPAEYEAVHFIDTHPSPGAYIRNDGKGPQDLSIGDGSHARNVKALTWEHAEMLYAKQLKCDEGGGVYADDLAKCDCCGQTLRYVVIFAHKPSGKYIGVGQDCAKRFSLVSQSELEELKLYKYRRDLKGQFRNYLASHPGMLVVFSVDDDLIIQDIARRSRNYGAPTDRQASYAAQRAIWSVERGLKQAAEDHAPKVPVVEGDKVVIRGKVVSKKWKETEWGGSMKIVVCDERGFKVWGTSPSRLGAEVGDVIEFQANVRKSDNDEHFGFFSRPCKAKAVERTRTEQESEVA